MACCLSSNNSYRWLVLVGVCFSQMLRAGFISGTISLFAIYYVDIYKDRALSSNIGSVQLSVANIASFPIVLLNKKIGERWTQLIGGFLTAGGMAGTAFTTQVWQGFLANGAMTGIGSAFLSAATYSALSKYFPGSHLAPYAAITMCQNIGVVATPKIIEIAMETLGFKYSFLICAASMTTNIAIGFAFTPPAEEDDESLESELTEDEKTERSPSTISLKVEMKTKGVYTLPRIEENPAFLRTTTMKQERMSQVSLSSLVNEVYPNESTSSSYKDSKVIEHNSDRKSIGNSSNKDSEKFSNNNLKSEDLNPDAKDSFELSPPAVVFVISDASDTLSISHTESIKGNIDLETNPEVEAQVDQPHTLSKGAVSERRGISIAELLEDKGLAKQSLKNVFKSKAAVNVLVTSFITTGGYIAFNSNVGDFCTMQLKYTHHEFVQGLTILGISQLVTGIIYLIITRFVTFSASFLYVLAIFGSSAVTFSLLTNPSIDTFYVIMVISGIFKSVYIASTFGAGMEVTSPVMAVFMFMLVSLVEGVGGLVFPYVSSYLQVQVNVSAGMYMAGGTQALGAISLLPLSIYYLRVPKTYTPDPELHSEIDGVDYRPNCC